MMPFTLWNIIESNTSRNIQIENFSNGALLKAVNRKQVTCQQSSSEESSDSKYSQWRMVNLKDNIFAIKNVEQDCYLASSIELEKDIFCANDGDIQKELKFHWELTKVQNKSQFNRWEPFMTTIKKENDPEIFQKLSQTISKLPETPSDISKMVYKFFTEWTKNLAEVAGISHLYFYLLIEIGKIRNALACLQGLLVKNIMGKEKLLVDELKNVPFGYCFSLRNCGTENTLHSHPIDYYHQNSSGKQQVTCSPYKLNKDDLWVIIPSQKSTNTFVKYGDSVSIVHMQTHSFLCSQNGLFSPITKGQEVFCVHKKEMELFGQKDDSKSWKIVGEGKKEGELVLFGDIVIFQHVVTGHFLYSHREAFDVSKSSEKKNIQQEVLCSKDVSSEVQWTPEFYVNLEQFSK
jgi:hypothetical protein